MSRKTILRITKITCSSNFEAIVCVAEADDLHYNLSLPQAICMAPVKSLNCGKLLHCKREKMILEPKEMVVRIQWLSMYVLAQSKHQVSLTLLLLWIWNKANNFILENEQQVESFLSFWSRQIGCCLFHWLW